MELQSQVKLLQAMLGELAGFYGRKHIPEKALLESVDFVLNKFYNAVAADIGHAPEARLLELYFSVLGAIFAGITCEQLPSRSRYLLWRVIAKLSQDVFNLKKFSLQAALSLVYFYNTFLNGALEDRLKKPKRKPVFPYWINLNNFTLNESHDALRSHLKLSVTRKEISEYFQNASIRQRAPDIDMRMLFIITNHLLALYADQPCKPCKKLKQLCAETLSICPYVSKDADSAAASLPAIVSRITNLILQNAVCGDKVVTASLRAVGAVLCVSLYDEDIKNLKNDGPGTVQEAKMGEFKRNKNWLDSTMAKLRERLPILISIKPKPTVEFLEFCTNIVKYCSTSLRFIKKHVYMSVLSYVSNENKEISFMAEEVIRLIYTDSDLEGETVPEVAVEMLKTLPLMLSFPNKLRSSNTLEFLNCTLRILNRRGSNIEIITSKTMLQLLGFMEFNTAQILKCLNSNGELNFEPKFFDIKLKRDTEDYVLNNLSNLIKNIVAFNILPTSRIMDIVSPFFSCYEGLDTSSNESHSKLASLWITINVLKGLDGREEEALDILSTISSHFFSSNEYVRTSDPETCLILSCIGITCGVLNKGIQEIVVQGGLYYALHKFNSTNSAVSSYALNALMSMCKAMNISNNSNKELLKELIARNSDYLLNASITNFLQPELKLDALSVVAVTLEAGGAIFIDHISGMVEEVVDLLSKSWTKDEHLLECLMLIIDRLTRVLFERGNFLNLKSISWEYSLKLCRNSKSIKETSCEANLESCTKPMRDFCMRNYKKATLSEAEEFLTRKFPVKDSFSKKESVAKSTLQERIALKIIKVMHLYMCSYNYRVREMSLLCTARLFILLMGSDILSEMHIKWPYLVSRLEDKSIPVFCAACTCILTACELAKDFLVPRVKKDVIPILESELERISKNAKPKPRSIVRSAPCNFSFQDSQILSICLSFLLELIALNASVSRKIVDLVHCFMNLELYEGEVVNLAGKVLREIISRTNLEVSDYSWFKTWIEVNAQGYTRNNIYTEIPKTLIKEYKMLNLSASCISPYLKALVEDYEENANFISANGGSTKWTIKEQCTRSSM